MKPHTPDFTLLDHTADMGMCVRAPDLRTLFEDAARAMMMVMVETGDDAGPNTRGVSLEGADLPDLMVRWLGELLYLFEGQGELVTETRLETISPTRLDAAVKTVAFDPERHDVVCDIKAVTYHQIQVAQRGPRWECRVIFDV